SLDDVRRLADEADQLGLARFVITGGEPLVMKDFDDVVAAIGPDRHYIVTDTNGWFLDDKKARHLKAIGVEKVQLSLDSYIEAEHDQFRNKPGSYKRVMRAITACVDAGLNLILSTVLIRDRVKNPEFEALCQFCNDNNVGLYVSYAKPTGSCTDHPEFVITKEDADLVRDLEKKYKVFTHMTPSYGSFKGCITVKGIITVTSTMEVTPCPYIDFSVGNLRQSSLAQVLAQGMSNPWIGPYRPDCIIGEDPDFIRLHQEKTRNAKLLPLPWGQGFAANDQLPVVDTPALNADFDQHGRCLPRQVTAPAHVQTRRRFTLRQPVADLAAIHARTGRFLGDAGLPSLPEFSARIEALRQRLAADPQLAPLLAGVQVPFLLPADPVGGDPGELLEQRYLPAVAASFREHYPAYQFDDHHSAGSLAGRLSVTPESRHPQLLAAQRDAAVVGLYFPCLSEYSIPAARERLASLPEALLLAGGVDTCAALVGSPDLLQNPEAYPPLLWLAALQSQPGEAYHFEAYGHHLTFNRRKHFDQSSEYACSALVVLG
ncbi:MAG: hypothetical protein RIR00_1478, partial [Pseudomonadota bacterium]